MRNPMNRICVGVLAAILLCGGASAMNKAELIDAMAKDAGLSKADAGNALNAFTQVASKSLAEGWSIEMRTESACPGVDNDCSGGDDVVGVLSVGDGGVGLGGCPVGGEVNFVSGGELDGRLASISGNPLYSGNGTSGENPIYEGRAPQDSGKCDKPEYMLDNNAMIKMMIDACRLPYDVMAKAYPVMLIILAEEVGGGGYVDLGDFGRFQAETTVTLSVVEPCAGTPEECLNADGTLAESEVVWQMSTIAIGAREAQIRDVARELVKQAKRAARTGRNPQTGKEIKIAAKKVAKFKAGKALADTVK